MPVLGPCMGAASDREGKAEGGSVVGALRERCRTHSDDESRDTTRAQPRHLRNSAETCSQRTQISPLLVRGTTAHPWLRRGNA